MQFAQICGGVDVVVVQLDVVNDGDECDGEHAPGAARLGARTPGHSADHGPHPHTPADGSKTQAWGSEQGGEHGGAPLPSQGMTHAQPPGTGTSVQIAGGGQVPAQDPMPPNALHGPGTQPHAPVIES